MTLISQDDYLTAEAWAAYGSLKDKKNSIQKKILPFVTQYHLALSNRWGNRTLFKTNSNNNITKENHLNISWSELILKEKV